MKYKQHDDKVISLWQQGLNNVEIAKQVPLHVSTIGCIVRKLDNRIDRLTDEQIADHVRAHHTTDTVKAMASVCSVSVRHLRYVVKKLGLKTKHGRPLQFTSNQIEIDGKTAKVWLTNIKDWCMIDAKDIDKIAGRHWYAWKTKTDTTWYVRHSETNTEPSQFMHRVIMDPPANKVINHRNWNGLDNRRKNLQVCTQRTNMRHINPERIKVRVDATLARQTARRLARAAALEQRKLDYRQERIDDKVWKMLNYPLYCVVRNSSGYIAAIETAGKRKLYLGTFGTIADAKAAIILHCSTDPFWVDLVNRTSQPGGKQYFKTVRRKNTLQQETSNV